VIGRRGNERLQLSFHVVEAKLRERETVGPGDQQLTRTLETLHASFAPTSIGQFEAAPEPADSPFWRRELLEAIQQTASRSDRDQLFAGLVVVGAESRHGGLSGEIRDSIVEGTYEVADFRGILCSIAAGEEDRDQSLERRDAGHDWIRVGMPDLARVLRAIREGARPTPRRAPPIETGGGGPSVSPDRTGEGAAGPTAIPTPVPTRSPDDRVVPATTPSDRGIGEAELARRYERVLDALVEFNVQVHQPDGERYREGPSFYEVRVVPATGVRAEAVLAQADNIKLRLELPAEHRIRGFVDRGTVTFEIPKDDEDRYFVEAGHLWQRVPRPEKGLYVPLGEDVRGNVVGVDFSSSDTPHMLIGGTTGSGKSYAMETLLAGLCHYYGPEELRLMLVDPKGTEFTPFENSPHLHGAIGAFPEDAIELLAQQVSEMQRRYAALKERRVRSVVELSDRVPADQCPPWHLVVLDEYADLSGDRAERTEIEASLRRLAQKARAAGIHVIVATQKPSAEILSTTIRSNLPVQLALRVKTAQDSRIIMDESGAETLAGMGDAFLKTARACVRVQCAYVERPRDEE